MMTEQTLTCQCGKMEWTIDTSRGTRVVCHCADCQTFARHLAPETDPLDAAGGTHVFQTLPTQVRIQRGADRLEVLRLSPKGLLRFYAGCCRTPVANVLPRAGISFVGLVLPPETDAFGKIVARAFTDSARRPVKGHGMPRAGAEVLLRMISGRIAGAHRGGPFRDADGAPVSEPVVISKAERAAARPG